MTKLDLGELIADIDRQIERLAGQRGLLMRLREMGAVVEVPDQAAQEQPAQQDA